MGQVSWVWGRTVLGVHGRRFALAVLVCCFLIGGGEPSDCFYKRSITRWILRSYWWLYLCLNLSPRCRRDRDMSRAPKKMSVHASADMIRTATELSSRFSIGSSRWLRIWKDVITVIKGTLNLSYIPVHTYHWGEIIYSSIHLDHAIYYNIHNTCTRLYYIIMIIFIYFI